MDSCIVVGIPGSGKSTSLNALAGRLLFDAGLSMVRGRTVHARRQSIHVGNDMVDLYDTPGLSDFVQRRHAAAEIRSAFQSVKNHGGVFSLIFFVTLEGGRVRPEDMDTLLSIKNSVLVDGPLSYSIVFNKVESRLLSMLDDTVPGGSCTNREHLLNKIRQLLDDRSSFINLDFLPFCLDLHGKDNVLPSDLCVFQEVMTRAVRAGRNRLLRVGDVVSAEESIGVQASLQRAETTADLERAHARRLQQEERAYKQTIRDYERRISNESSCGGGCTVH